MFAVVISFERIERPPAISKYCTFQYEMRCLVRESRRAGRGEEEGHQLEAAYAGGE